MTLPARETAPVVADAADNALLRHLRPEELKLLTPITEVWAGEEGAVLFEPGDAVDYTYFPCGRSAASLRVVFPDGDVVETCLIGREGAVGGIVSEGHLPAFTRSIVQIAGGFLKVRTARLQEAKLRSPFIHHLFARYADCLLAQVFQATACNARHSIEQRTAKWILSAMERTNGESVPLTQEQLAGMLGVGRSYVNRVMRSWKADGLVEWRRGSLQINKLDALKTRECACNAAVRAHYASVMGAIYPKEPRRADRA
ncbi:MAG: helix-turn-helix domain-containing protein [Alphaproteobacteria bacterium]|nr:helix-turn-helix domain-containing protein [Alphaproteobacteria bacterium]